MKDQNPAEPEQRLLDQKRADENAPSDAILYQDPKPVVHLSVEHVYGPEDVPYEPDELVVVCLVRNGRPYVRSFVEHYRSLGVKHMFFLDNDSTDGTIEALKGYDDVTVLRTRLSYKNPKGGLGGTEALFKQYLIGRFGKEDRWCLCADIDELFDYPYSDVVGLGSLLGYLTEKSYTAVAAQMLDMFPEEPLSGHKGDQDEPLKERHRFYDLSNISRKNLNELSRLRNNTLESDEIEVLSGGIRNTIFSTASLLTKFPLVFLDGWVKPMDGSSHWVDNARIADLTCVLFHYKFLDEHFHKQAAQAVREGQYYNNSALYKKYLKVLESSPTLRVKQETSKEIESVNELLENGFLVVSEEYMMAVYDEEERKKGTGHAPPLRGGRGGPGGPGDEVAFYRARAQVQGLRVRRLERHLEELREQHQREADKVEKLSSRLAKVRKKNHNLMRQLQSMQASRGLRLLNKFGHLRARVLGR